MPGLSDSRQPDDVRIHLQQIIAADDERKAAVQGESVRAASSRQSSALTQALRAKVDAVFREVAEYAPGLSAAEVSKLTTTRAARDSLKQGVDALSRVDSHLRAATGQREPEVGRNYGVFGANPTSIAGVYRALAQSVTENERVGKLADGVTERELLFTPFIATEVNDALTALSGVVGVRIQTRADLSRKILLKAELVDRAVAAISAVRNHLYANLPLRKRDPDLRHYGFRPVKARRSGADPDDAVTAPAVLPELPATPSA